jgi:hypothetical protein
MWCRLIPIERQYFDCFEGSPFTLFGLAYLEFSVCEFRGIGFGGVSGDICVEVDGAIVAYAGAEQMLFFW